jgi:hypothetical protein
MFLGYRAAEIPQMRRGRCSTRLCRVDQRTSDLVSIFVGGEEEQVVVSPDERSRWRSSSGLEREFDFSFLF